MSDFRTISISFDAQDRPNTQPPAAQRKKKKHFCGFDNGSRGGSHHGRWETEMRMSPNGNINTVYGVGAPWFWGGGEIPMHGNRQGMGAPCFMGGCHMTPPIPPIPPVPPVPPIPPTFVRCSGAGPWTCGSVEVTMSQDSTEGVNYGGKPARNSTGNINLEPGSGSNYYWSKGEIKVPPSANGNINIGLGAGGVNSGYNSASFNYHYGTINI